MIKTCEVEGCTKPIRALGLCNSHYLRQRTLGDPLSGGLFRGAPLSWIRGHRNHDDNECLIWPFSRNNRGYGRIVVQGREWLAHRYMLCTSEGAPPHSKAQAAHSCGNGHLGCCNPNHLYWTTQSGNETDKIVHGTSNRGKRNGMSVLTESAVLDVVSMRSSGSSYSEIAKKYTISFSAISDIVNGRSWSWLTGISAGSRVP